MRNTGPDDKLSSVAVIGAFFLEGGRLTSPERASV